MRDGGCTMKELGTPEGQGIMRFSVEIVKSLTSQRIE